MTDKRKKLETNIERQIHGLVSDIREHVVDFTVLKVRKHHPNLDREQLSVVLEVVKQAIDDGFLTRVDRFMKKIESSLEEFHQDENKEVTAKADTVTIASIGKKPGRPESKRA